MKIESRELSALRAHPENAVIFGNPSESPQYAEVLASVRKYGIQEPLLIRADGTILSGHLRLAAARRLKLTEVPVRVVPPFASARDELEYVIRSNTARRQLQKWEIALAFKRLKEIPAEDGGAKRKMGRPAKGDEKSGARPRLSDARSREDAAKTLGIGTDEARALETVFTTDGVPRVLRDAVNRGDVAPTPAAKAIRAEVKRQGGEIKDAGALTRLASPPKAAPGEPASVDHQRRVAAEAERYQADYRTLHEIYCKTDALLSRRPLKSLLGPTEHHEYGALLRDLAIRVWREIESVQGPTNAGRQMTLALVPGGKQ